MERHAVSPITLRRYKVTPIEASSMLKIVSERSTEAWQGMRAVQDLKSCESFMREHADRLKALISSFEALYTAMPDAQKKVADEVFRRIARTDRLVA